MKLLEWLKAKYREFRNPYVTAVDVMVVANKRLTFDVFIVLSNGKKMLDKDPWGQKYRFHSLSQAEVHAEYVKKELVAKKIPIKLGW